MKPVNKKIEDEFHKNSVEGVDAVLARMFEALGRPMWGGYAEVFDVSANTLKTWRRRGSVSTKFLQGFAKEHGLSLDYLLYGDDGQPEDEIVLTATEKTLIEAYRAATNPLRDAALRVLRGDSPTPGAKQTIGGAVGGHVISGGVKNSTLNVGRKKK